MQIPLSLATFPEPFPQSLEFNPPCRGPWNIVHMALQLPETHLIYVCARGCLRGVVMTAHEMGAAKRMSSIGIQEADLSLGTLFDTTYNGIKHILEKRSSLPKQVILSLSCVQQFSHFDYPSLIKRLQTRFPEITFIDCCMMPTMRKSGPNDEQRTKAKMYDGIKPVSAPEKNSISIIGMEQNLHECLLLSILRENGYTIRSLPLCKTYTDYQELGKSKTMLTLSDDAFLAGQQLATRMNANHIHLPIRYTPDAILEDLNTLIHTLKLTVDPKKLEQAKIFALTSLKKAADSLSKTPLALDYTFAPRTLNLAKLLLECGFSLTTLYLDAFNSAEEADFKDLQKYPLTLVQTVAPLRTYPAPTHTLCLGQKAAYFSGSTHFVNCVGGGGLCDFSGLSTLADLIMDAHTKPKNLRQTLLHKGLGLPSFITQPLWDYHA